MTIVQMVVQEVVEIHVVEAVMDVQELVGMDVPHVQTAVQKVVMVAQAHVGMIVQVPVQVTVTNPVQVAVTNPVAQHVYLPVPTTVWMPALPVPHVQANVPQLVWVVLMLVKQDVPHVLPVPRIVAVDVVSPATPPVTVTVMESV